MRRDPLALLIPVLRRPRNVAAVLNSIDAATARPYRVVFLASPGDVSEIVAIESAGGCPLDHVPHARVVYLEHDGNYAAKINAGIRATTEPLIFTGADDLSFHPGWLDAALERMEETGAMVVGTQDRCNPRVIAGEHATHFLVSRTYVEEHGTLEGPGELLHEGYEHEYVDDELIGTASARGLYAFADRSVVEHLHPLAGHPSDELYEAAGERMRRSRPLYLRRRRLWQSPGA